MPENPPKTLDSTLPALADPAATSSGEDPALDPPGSGLIQALQNGQLAHLEHLAETARDYARGAKAPATMRAYASDWRHYTAWCERKGLDALPPDPEVIGLYLAACASGQVVSGQVGSGKVGAGKIGSGNPDQVASSGSSVSTIERRLSAIAWHCAQRGNRSTAPIGTSRNY
jgi:hypothetical protein